MRQLLFHPFVAAGVTILWLGMMWSLVANYHQIRNTSEKVRVLEQEKSKIASEVSEKEALLTEAQSAYQLERIARNELLLQKPGEYVVQVVLPTQAQTSESALSVSNRGIWQEWKAVLKL